MGNVPSATVASGAPPRRRLLLLAGVLLFLLGPALYVVQFRLKHLWTPWYVPVLASFGFVLLLLWARRSRIWVRIAVLVVGGLVCGLGWFALIEASRTPAYTGPAKPGNKLPTFSATLADGRAFTNRDLEAGTPTVLLFFRGRW
jgi:hypothetical protein